jgi:hypothetical protein
MNDNGGLERARARVWTDRNIETCYQMNKEESQIVATSLVTTFVGAVAAGDITSIPRLMNKE